MLATASADAVRAEEPGWSALGRKQPRCPAIVLADVEG